ncbi:Choline/ethanolaminephosphotransferase 1 [Nymphaea thermarum]|nr:Choline/ethanolaminephosphotransferase 1 [Nymphaea thermarum]
MALFICLIFGVCFIQTFDAVDGKQARRTNSSSPLGELFDHGCDALTCAFEALAFGSTAMCGKDTFWFWVIAAVPFYCATWEHFFTNTLILPEINGPTEGLMLIYMAHFFTAAVGAEWWVQDFRLSFPILNWIPLIPEIPTYRMVLFLMIVGGVVPTVSYNIFNVHKVVRARRGSMFLALAMVLSLSFRYHAPPSSFADSGNWGRMILAHLCDEPKGLKTGMIPLIDEYLILLGYCAFTALLFLLPL